MEGDSVTLHVDPTDIQDDVQLQWKFTYNNADTCLAQMHTRYGSSSVFDNVGDGRFRDRLKLNSQTGFLTITNITNTDSGVFTLEIISGRGTSYKRFNVTVYAHLPVPVIIRNSSQCSSSSGRSTVSKCVLLCSVMNVTHVSLSWYKGNSLLSIISVSDLNIRLSLPLEVEYQDTNTYRCVVNNTITNHTQHLHINDVCQSCSGLKEARSHLIAIVVAVLWLLTIAAVAIWKNKNKLISTTARCGFTYQSQKAQLDHSFSGTETPETV
ncbi:uncharacterized protein LOC130430077 [Triplophysa dalaica]|uniref:uncharacterized protein LOC130430077 n=1 Tax=Triplophysa dalaica TaxID=1582913 RepID=UPI0024DF30E6|nr:uncharacterized protein LOC130430077 [Triplophysa dalaica]XP_056614991.1 uncharacterized protein LOC130430077 [Triplophysa dalaica]XP_056614992.1 uncharacterized protein LOC130430077 [Triplophysa dalaica]XP_056614993.1 uncharacterized protein LOC130430077 [Triplophysa dalaica]XP_056614994.1 uncharacterized protein LOC130430077 [Triplophysa dalaica]XP_056614996.1 uncharacterized protein LOC130430077 [Triplophysa dalaica]